MSKIEARDDSRIYFLRYFLRKAQVIDDPRYVSSQTLNIKDLKLRLLCQRMVKCHVALTFDLGEENLRHHSPTTHMKWNLRHRTKCCMWGPGPRTHVRPDRRVPLSSMMLRSAQILFNKDIIKRWGQPAWCGCSLGIQAAHACWSSTVTSMWPYFTCTPHFIDAQCALQVNIINGL